MSSAVDSGHDARSEVGLAARRSSGGEWSAVLTPREVRHARGELGRMLAGWRRRAGLTQAELAGRVCYSRSTIGSVETGYQGIARSFWERADRVLGAGGVLVAAFDQVDALARDHRAQMAQVRARQRRLRAGRAQSGVGAGVAAPEAACGCGCGRTVACWGGRQVRALREAMRLTVPQFASLVGVTAATARGWERVTSPGVLRMPAQAALDRVFKDADEDARSRFWQLNQPGPDHRPGRF